MSAMNSKATIAIVTGGSRDLGRSMALHLAERGAAVAQADEVREHIRSPGRKVVALPLDVADTGKFEANTP